MLDWIEKHPGLAGWVQGIGSLIAIIAAVWVARWQAKRESKLRQTAQRAAAEVVSSSIARSVNLAITNLKAIRIVVEGYDAGIDVDEDLKHRANVLQLVPPTETQLLQLAPVEPAAAVSLARAYSVIGQVSVVFQRLDDPEKTHIKPARIASLIMMISAAERDLEIAKRALDKHAYQTKDALK